MNLTKPQAAELILGIPGMQNLEDDACFDQANCIVDCETSALVPASASLSAAVKSYMFDARCSYDLCWFDETWEEENEGRVFEEVLTDAVNTQYIDW